MRNILLLLLAILLLASHSLAELQDIQADDDNAVPADQAQTNEQNETVIVLCALSALVLLPTLGGLVWCCCWPTGSNERSSAAAHVALAGGYDDEAIKVPNDNETLKRPHFSVL